jgi:3-deoxy-7-phosphoheptulonate synthase
MVIVMQSGASDKDIDYVIRRARSLGLKTHVSAQNGHTLIGLSGDLKGLNPDAITGLRGVECVRPMSRPYRLASKEFKSEPTTVKVRDVVIGGNEVVVMAGPCSVETPESMLRTAKGVKEAGARLFRGGAFKPRSSPYSFQGLAEEGLKILAAVRDETGLPIVTEVLSSEHVSLVAKYADVLQIGTRNMQNYMLLHAAGETKMPVLLKRGMMSTIEEFLLSAEYILSHGNPNVLLCERGIRTFETYTRNSLDINTVPALKELSHLPVIVDPSHATGKRSLVTAVSRAAVAAGADGLIIEVHYDPELAWSDAFQTISVGHFGELTGAVGVIAGALGRSTVSQPEAAGVP